MGQSFDIYSCAYLADKEARALVKYRRLIMYMAWKNYNWVKYDKGFLRLRETSPEEYLWDMTELQLWAECAVPKPTNNRPWSSQDAANQEQGWQHYNSQEPFRGAHGDKGSKALECVTATTGETSAQTPVVSSTVAVDAVLNTSQSIAAELEEIVTPVNAQQLNDWLTGYDPETRGHLHTGFTKGFQINCRAAAGTLQQEGGLQNHKFTSEKPDMMGKMIQEGGGGGGW